MAFIGAGPGAADLITVRGAQRLAQAEVVLFDALTDPALQALAPRARWVDVGKRGFGHATGQAAINALLVQAAQAHARVVRLKGGDPSVFGRLEEEMAALQQAGIGYEVVPGVSAALAAAAGTQRPLTRRGSGRSVSLRGLACRLARRPDHRPHRGHPGRRHHAPCRPSRRGDGGGRRPAGAGKSTGARPLCLTQLPPAAWHGPLKIMGLHPGGHAAMPAVPPPVCHHNHAP